MIELLRDLGFTPQDLALAYLCALGSAAGSFVQVIMSYWRGFTTLPSASEPGAHPLPWSISLARSVFLLCRLAVGAVLGFTFGLSLTGALREGAGVAGRIIALSVLVGYSAPQMFERQQQTVQAAIDKLSETKLQSEPLPPK